MSLLDFSICLIVAIAGYNLKLLFKSFNRSDRQLLDLLWTYHLMVAIAFHFYIENFGGDAINYWGFPKQMTFDQIISYLGDRTASATVFLINYLPSNLLELQFITGNLLYALFGYLGFIYLLLILKEQHPDLRSIKSVKIVGLVVFPLFLFLPNFHFWSGGIGKDTLLFTAILGFIWGMRNSKLRWKTLIWTSILALAVRPHILLFLLASFGAGFLLDRRMKVYQKVFVLAIFAVGFAAIFGYVMSFIQLESLESEAITEYANTRSSNLNNDQSSSGVDISGYPLLLKVFTFLFRPLFFDINGILAIVASFENLFLLLFSRKVLMSKPLKHIRKGDFWIKGVVVFFLLSGAAFSLILGNLGIMLRQKNMIIPCLFVIGFYILMKHAKFKSLSNEGAASHQ